MNTDLRSSWELLDGLVRDNMLILGYNLYNTIDNAIEVSKGTRCLSKYTGSTLTPNRKQDTHCLHRELELAETPSPAHDR
jgi:hypothetical protein